LEVLADLVPEDRVAPAGSRPKPLVAPKVSGRVRLQGWVDQAEAVREEAVQVEVEGPAEVAEAAVVAGEAAE
jgi:hypothetical protein